MYSVNGTDIIFACIMCAIAMVLTYLIGRITQKGKMTNKLANLITNRTSLCREYNELMEAFHSERARWDTATDMQAIAEKFALQEQKRELNKKQRLAMAKYKAKCDAKLVLHMDLLRDSMYAHESQGEKNRAMLPDYSNLLSK